MINAVPMIRYFLLFYLAVIGPLLSAQTGVDETPPVDPDPSAAESPTLWILLAVILLGGLLFLRSRTRKAVRR